MKINGKEYLSPQEQLVENTKDIEELKQLVKPVYQTTATLTSSSVSVALSDTNVGTATEGWLMTNDGLLFKITANDGTTVLLIYYADLKGPQGESGAAVNIDDTGTAVDKCWSSNKTNNQINTEVAKAKDKGIYWTSTLPTPVDGTYTYAKLDLSNINSDIPFKSGDLIIYVDTTDPSNPVVSKMLQMDDVSDPDYVTAIAIGDIGGGKTLYQHNLHLSGTNIEIYCQLVNDSSTAFSTLLSLSQWLYSKGFYYASSPHYRNSLQASGLNNASVIIGIQDNGNNNGQLYGVGEINGNLSLTTVKDTVITL